MTDVPTFSVDELFNDEDARRAERYRLAWMSARQRAMNHLLALVESDDERDALRAALADEQGSHAMTSSSFEIVVESMREDAAKLHAQIARHEQQAIAHAERHRVVFDDCLRQIAELTDQRDEARAEVERAHARANEAARLSADARDEAEALNGVIAELREQLGIVEGDRLNNDNWALNVLAEHGLGYNLDDLLSPIAEYLRAPTAERNRLGDYANGLVQRFDEARAEVVRLGKQLEAQRIAADAGVSKAHREAGAW